MVFPDGETEVLQTHVAIGKAKAQGLDLVLVSPTANPPVAKVMDYGEYTYLEKKKKNEAKKKQHRIEVKEVKFRPNTDQHDYNFKKNHAIRFLEEGNKVKAVVFFRGREITHSDLGRKLLANLAKDVGDLGELEGHPRIEGRQMHVIIGPKKRKKEPTREQKAAPEASVQKAPPPEPEQKATPQAPAQEAPPPEQKAAPEAPAQEAPPTPAASPAS